jgi:hypothetical protein
MDRTNEKYIDELIHQYSSITIEQAEKEIAQLKDLIRYYSPMTTEKAQKEIARLKDYIAIISMDEENID